MPIGYPAGAIYDSKVHQPKRAPKSAHTQRIADKRVRPHEAPWGFDLKERRRLEKVVAARKKNGVGRPPKLNFAREMYRIISRANAPAKMTWRLAIIVPPGKTTLLLDRIRANEVCFSTAALRKSKQRKGRA